VHVIENQRNLGYAAGNNVGLESAISRGADYVFVINNDTTLDPSCLRYLVTDMESTPDAAAAAPKSLYFDAPQTIYFAGGRISPAGETLHEGVGTPDVPECDSPCDTEWLTGCAILFRVSALRSVGLLDPRYFLLYEDADWSLRARRLGWRLRFVPGARLWHKVSLSFGQTWSAAYLYYYARNRCLWIERNFPFQRRCFLYRCAVRRSFDHAARGGTIGLDGNRRGLRQAVWRGLSDYALRRFGARSYGW
jgi:GT2 family glycosyltransferase